MIRRSACTQDSYSTGFGKQKHLSILWLLGETGLLLFHKLATKLRHPACRVRSVLQFSFFSEDPLILYHVLCGIYSPATHNGSLSLDFLRSRKCG